MSLHLLLESNHTAENTAATTAGGRLIPSENTLNIVYYNARSLLPKLDDLKGIIETESPDIICIVETWLSSDILDNELAVSNYQIFRRDRNRHGGGVMMYVHSCLTVDLHACVADIEFISICVTAYQTIYLLNFV